MIFMSFNSGCIQTVKTPPIIPGKKSQSIMVGSCDNGPLEFSIQPSNDGKSIMVIYVMIFMGIKFKDNGGSDRNRYIRRQIVVYTFYNVIACSYICKYCQNEDVEKFFF